MAAAMAEFGAAEAAGLEQLKTALLTKRGASLRKSGMLFLCRLWVRRCPYTALFHALDVISRLRMCV